MNYEDRLRSVLAELEELPRGTRMMIAADLHVAPITVSHVLNGKIVRPDLLDTIESWLSNETVATITERQSLEHNRIALVNVFVNSELTSDVQYTMDVDEVYDMYTRWCNDQYSNITPLPKARFTLTLRSRWPVAVLGNGKRVFAGVRALQEARVGR